MFSVQGRLPDSNRLQRRRFILHNRIVLLADGMRFVLRAAQLEGVELHVRLQSSQLRSIRLPGVAYRYTP